jgi:D-glycero-D-manno-heptose 1,7-bisphosphate phosphatase
VNDSRWALLDRDGTVLEQEVGTYVLSPDAVRLLPGAADGIRRLRAGGFGVAVVTNQAALGRGWIDREQLDAIHARMQQLLGPGAHADAIYVCPHRPEDACDCRKPAPGLLRQAAREHGFVPAQATVIGDKPSDIEAGRAVGARTVLVLTGEGAASAAAGTRADHVVADLTDAAELLVSQHAREAG